MPSDKAVGADNQQERSVGGDVALTMFRERAKELLGDAYTKEKVDAILNSDPSKNIDMMSELNDAANTTNPVERRRNFNAWYKKWLPE